MRPRNFAGSRLRSEVSCALEGVFWASGLAGNARPALAALQIVEVEAQQTCGDMNVSAMRTHPRRLRNIVVAFPGHRSTRPMRLILRGCSPWCGPAAAYPICIRSHIGYAPHPTPGGDLLTSLRAVLACFAALFHRIASSSALMAAAAYAGNRRKTTNFSTRHQGNCQVDVYSKLMSTI